MLSFSEGAYRARQFFHALFPRLSTEHLAEARSILSESEFALFRSMQKRDQRHGLRVLHHLHSEGHEDRELAAAALLHDCGKGEVPVWLRVLYVVSPSFVDRLAHESEGARRHDYGWCLSVPAMGPAMWVLGAIPTSKAAYRLANHARLGAELARAAGSSETTVRYIGGDVAEHERHRHMALRAADDRS